jgi:hypothetical protein
MRRALAVSIICRLKSAWSDHLAMANTMTMIIYFDNQY